MRLPLQSLEPFYQSPYSMCVGEFLLCFFAMKIMFLLILTILFFAIGIFSTNYVTAYAISGILFLLSYFIQEHVHPHSAIGFLQEGGFTVLLDTQHYFTTARNVNAFGVLVPTIVVGVVFMLFWLFVFMGLSVLFWICSREWKFDGGAMLQKRSVTGKRKYHPLFFFECKKLMIAEHGWILAVGFVAVMLYLHVPSRHEGMVEYYYEMYAAQLEGPLSFDKECMLRQEKERFHRAKQRAKSMDSTSYCGKMDEGIPSEQEYAFGLVSKQYEELLERKSRGCAVTFINESGWSKICDREAKKSSFGITCFGLFF